MVDLNALFEFSRIHCIAICAFLVPANLLATIQILFWVGLNRPPSHIQFTSLVGSIYALAMILHVATWFMIGVVMPPTFILLGLALTCLGISGWAIAFPHSLHSLLKQGQQKLFSPTENVMEL